jgi:DNA-binding CsgD family transcriptional regulator/Tol biopolymer transport system component
MRRGRPPYPGLLTAREQQVLDLIRQGLTNEQIAQHLGISVSGARYHVAEILSKLGVNSRQEAALWSPEPTGARRFGVFGALFGRIASSVLTRVAGSLAIAAGLGVLLALFLGVIEMNSREAPWSAEVNQAGPETMAPTEEPGPGLPSIDMQWAEVAAPAPQGTETARPFFTDVDPDGSDLWRAYVVHGASAPALALDSRRYLSQVFWHADNTLTFMYATKLEGGAAEGLAHGAWQYSLTTNRTTWQQNYERSTTVSRPSPDGSRFALVNSGSNRVYIQEVGGRTWEVRSPGSQPFFSGWSPDGRSFAFIRGTQGTAGARPSYTSYLATPGQNKALVLGASIVSWSPDGSKLAASQGRDLLIFDSHRSTVQRIGGVTGDSISSGPPVWSPEGDYVSSGDALIDVEGGSTLYSRSGRPILASGVSPDGRWQAFILDPSACGVSPASATSELHLREVSTGNESTLLGCSDSFFTELKWLPNRKIIVAGPNCSSCEPTRYRVALVEPSTGRIQALTSGLETAARHYVSPDGKRILVTGTRLRVYTSDGVLEREITPPDGLPVIAAAWSPDGSSFTYIIGPLPGLI